MIKRFSSGLLGMVLMGFPALLLLTLPTLAQQHCTGPTPQHHSMTPYEFDTNSHVEKGDLAYETCIDARPKLVKGEYWRIDRCVYNPSDEYEFHFAWFVPGVESSVPPKCVMEFPHFLSGPTDKPPSPAPHVIKSCIEYGYAGGLTTAEYLADDAEKEAADKEDLKQCQPTAPLKAASLVQPLRPLAFDIELYLPSDGARREQTMLALAATYDVSGQGDGYSSTFKYQLSPVRIGPIESAGDPAAVSMRTILRGQAEDLTRYLTERNRTGNVQLRAEDSFELLRVRGEGPWQLVQAGLQFFDRSGKMVARTQIPLFVSGR